jgi:hypothetical protein
MRHHRSVYHSAYHSSDSACHADTYISRLQTVYFQPKKVNRLIIVSLEYLNASVTAECTVYPYSHKSDVQFWTNHRKVVWGNWKPKLTSFPEEVKSWTAVSGSWFLSSPSPVQVNSLNLVRHVQDFSVTQPLQLKWRCATRAQTTIPRAHHSMRIYGCGVLEKCRV